MTGIEWDKPYTRQVEMYLTNIKMSEFVFLVGTIPQITDFITLAIPDQSLFLLYQYLRKCNSAGMCPYIIQTAIMKYSWAAFSNMLVKRCVTAMPGKV